MKPESKDPKTPFILKGDKLSFCILDFWQWNQSDLLSNNLRGHLAEFIVMKALGIESTVREEWAPYDLITKEGINIEVKSGAYLQSWHQDKPSVISFGIAESFKWDKETGKYDTLQKRQSDVYVFCVFETQDKELANPLNLNQWTFYVIPTAVLNEKLGGQKTLTLGSLKRLGPQECKYNELLETFNSIMPTKEKLTLHEAIIRLLKQEGRPMTTTEIAQKLNENKWYSKKDGSSIDPFQIHGRTKNYPQYFKREGSTVSLIETI